MMNRFERLGDLAENGEVVAATLRAEADAICRRGDPGPRPAGRARPGDPAPDAGPRAAPADPLQHRAAGLRTVRNGPRRRQAAWSANRRLEVYVDETRPWLQGARLTAWELVKEGIPATLIADNMAGFFMNRGEITCCVVGADRIAANGDTANKIGTYSVAVLATENNVPFYVAAPVSTLDLSLSDGSQIPIEERLPSEVTHIKGVHRARGDQRPQPGLRRNAGRPDQRDRDRGGGPPGALPSGPGGGGRGPQLPGPSSRSADGQHRGRPAGQRPGRQDDHRPGAPAPVPRARPAVLGVRDLRPRRP